MNSAYQSDDGDTTVSAVASRRKSQAATFGYLGYPVTSPLMYLTTGELIRIITADSYWKLFKSFFPGAKKVSEMKFDEISSVRNDLAHFRPLKPNDVETVKQNSKHILTTVEKQLYQLMACPDTVPSNTKAEWYQALNTLGTDLCQVHFKQSEDEEWIRIDLTFRSVVLEHRSFNPRFHSYTFLTTDGPSILKNHPDLSNILIYCSESMMGERVSRDGRARPSKTVSFGFARTAVESEWKGINSAAVNPNVDNYRNGTH